MISNNRTGDVFYPGLFTLAKQARLGQIKARYIRLPDLLMEYGDASVIQGKQKRLLASYSKIPLLVIDE